MIRKWYALWLLYLISDKILKLMLTFWCDVFIDFSDFAKDYINYHYRFWKALPPNNLTLLAYNEVSYIFPFHFVKRQVFVLAACSDGNPLNIQPHGLPAWNKLLILIWKWWGSYWESRLSILLSTCCYSLSHSLFDSWFSSHVTLLRSSIRFFLPTFTWLSKSGWGQN